MMKPIHFAIVGAALLQIATAVAAETPFRAEAVSSFEPEEKVRNPFWPIGFAPEADALAPATVTEAKSKPINPGAFVVTSISLGAEPLAVINGKAYGEGEFISVPGGKEMVQVVRIGDGVVLMRHNGGEFQAGLRRR